jgi:hypothetical protein
MASTIDTVTLELVGLLGGLVLAVPVTVLVLRLVVTLLDATCGKQWAYQLGKTVCGLSLADWFCSPKARRGCRQRTAAWLFVDTTVGAQLDVLQALFSVTSVILYIWQSYRPEGQLPPGWVTTTEFVLTVYFLIDLLLWLILSPHPIKAYFSFQGIVDIVTVFPPLAGLILTTIIPEARQSHHSGVDIFTRVTGVLRVFRALRVLRIARLAPSMSFERQVFILILIVLSIVLATAGFLQAFENDEYMPFHRALYYATSTVVGRPGQPISEDGSYVFMSIVIFVSASVIPVVIAELVKLWLQSADGTVYKPSDKAERRHVIITGAISSAARLQALLTQFFHGGRDSSAVPDVVILFNAPLQGRLRELLDIFRVGGSVTYVRGSPQSFSDLHRAGITGAQACLLLAELDTDGKAASAADASVMAAAVAIKAASPNTALFAQIRRPRARFHLSCIPSWGVSDRALSVGETAASLLGVGALIPGFPTMVSNLVHLGKADLARRVTSWKSLARGAAGISWAMGLVAGKDAEGPEQWSLPRAFWTLTDSVGDKTSWTGSPLVSAMSPRLLGSGTAVTSRAAKSLSWRSAQPKRPSYSEYAAGFAQEVRSFRAPVWLSGKTFAAAARLAYLHYGVLLIAARVSRLRVQRGQVSATHRAELRLFPLSLKLTAGWLIYCVARDDKSVAALVRDTSLLPPKKPVAKASPVKSLRSPSGVELTNATIASASEEDSFDVDEARWDHSLPWPFLATSPETLAFSFESAAASEGSKFIARDAKATCCRRSRCSGRNLGPGLQSPSSYDTMSDGQSSRCCRKAAPADGVGGTRSKAMPLRNPSSVPPEEWPMALLRGVTEDLSGVSDVDDEAVAPLVDGTPSPEKTATAASAAVAPHRGHAKKQLPDDTSGSELEDLTEPTAPAAPSQPAVGGGYEESIASFASHTRKRAMLETHPEFGLPAVPHGHVLVCGASPELGMIVQSIRAGDGLMPSVVILAAIADRPSEAEVDAVHSGSAKWLSETHWFDGDPTSPEDLLRAGASSARAAIILSTVRAADARNAPKPAAPSDDPNAPQSELEKDVWAIAAASALYRVNPRLHVITQLRLGRHAPHIRPTGVGLRAAQASAVRESVVNASLELRRNMDKKRSDGRMGSQNALSTRTFGPMQFRSMVQSSVYGGGGSKPLVPTVSSALQSRTLAPKAPTDGRARLTELFPELQKPSVVATAAAAASAAVSSRGRLPFGDLKQGAASSSRMDPLALPQTSFRGDVADGGGNLSDAGDDDDDDDDGRADEDEDAFGTANDSADDDEKEGRRRLQEEARKMRSQAFEHDNFDGRVLESDSDSTASGDDVEIPPPKPSGRRPRSSSLGQKEDVTSQPVVRRRRAAGSPRKTDAQTRRSITGLGSKPESGDQSSRSASGRGLARVAAKIQRQAAAAAAFANPVKKSRGAKSALGAAALTIEDSTVRSKGADWTADTVGGGRGTTGLWGAPAFAAGRAFSSTTLDALLAEAYFTPHVIAVAGLLTRAAQGGKLIALPAITLLQDLGPKMAPIPLATRGTVPCAFPEATSDQQSASGSDDRFPQPPRGFLPATYGQLFEVVLREQSQLCLGLYRRVAPWDWVQKKRPQAQAHEELVYPDASPFTPKFQPWQLQYVFTNPPADTVLSMDDLVYMLSN